MNRPLADLRLAVIMLDGIDLHGRTNIVALGITTEGEKLALGLWDGSSENATVAGALLSDLVDRGLDVEQGLLFVIDGSKAPAGKPSARCSATTCPVQRCTQHKERNVLDHLPERDRQAVKTRLRRAWKETDHDRALEQLTTLALELDRDHPGAAASLREGMEETLTVTRLGITGKLKLTLQSTNPCESMISTVRVIHRNVKHWSSGDMCLRWTAAGMLEAETRFRKVEGYRGLATLAVKIEDDLLRRRQADTTPSRGGGHAALWLVSVLEDKCYRLPPTKRATALGACWVAWTRRQQALSDNSSSGDAAVFAGRLVAPARRESRRGAWLYRLLGSSSATTSTTARCASRSLDEGTSASGRRAGRLLAGGSACGVPIGLSWSPANSRSGSSLLGAGPAG